MTQWRNGLVVYALVIALCLSLPTLSASLNTPPDSLYTGALIVPSGFQVDYYSHMAKLWQGSRGEWAYHLMFTTEPHQGLIGVQGFYVLLGTLSRNPPFDFTLIYHGARFILNVLLILTVGAFIERFFHKTTERWVALIFATLVTGWGWLMYSLVPALTVPDPPIEFWLIDAYSLTGGLFMPHFSAAGILQLLTVMLLDDWLQKRGLWRLLVLTLIMGVSAIVQPYVVLLMLPLCALYAGYRLILLPRRASQLIEWRFLGLAVPFAAQGLVTVAQFVALTGDPVWRSFTAQNQTLSPTPIHYLFGYAPFLIPILIALVALIRRKAIRWPTQDQAHWLIPILWVSLVVLLIYAPFPTQRRYLLGIQSPLGVLAAWGWLRLVMPYFSVRKWVVTIGYVGSALISLMMLITLNLAGLTPSLHPEQYISSDTLTSAAWVRDNLPTDAHLLTFLDGQGQGSGGQVVWLTGRTVYLGHWVETAHFVDKVRTVINFYAESTADSVRQALLQDNAIDVIWYDQEARFLGDWRPENADYVEPIFATDTIQLYAPR